MANNNTTCETRSKAMDTNHARDYATQAGLTAKAERALVDYAADPEAAARAAYRIEYSHDRNRNHPDNVSADTYTIFAMMGLEDAQDTAKRHEGRLANMRPLTPDEQAWNETENTTEGQAARRAANARAAQRMRDAGF